MAIDMDALRAKAKQKNAEKRSEFIPVELNEGNVQAIFNRCLAKEGTTEDKCFKSLLFPTLKGYGKDAEKIVMFNKEQILANRKSIFYLYGQLKNVHSKKGTLQINEAFTSYTGDNWTLDKGVLLELLYLGAVNGGNITIITPFDAKTDSALLARTTLKPTLSPKDPAFPAWWEAHKGEWETE